MKITGIIVCGGLHHKNLSAIQKECALFNYNLLLLNDINDSRICENNKYNLIIFTDKFIELDINKFIIYGPQISVFPPLNIIDYIPNRPDRILNLLSDWNANSWKSCRVKMPIVTLPFGVDTDLFIPGILPRNEIFIYYKHRDVNILKNVINIIRSIHSFILINGTPLNHMTVIEYGHYKEEDYISLLKKSKFGIWIGCHESQGFALQEALASNVPLIVLNVSSMKEECINGRYTYGHVSAELPATSIPYWSDKCGIVLKSEDITMAINNLLKNYEYYEPRKFILENLSFSVCFNKMINLVENYLN